MAFNQYFLQYFWLIYLSEVRLNISIINHLLKANHDIIIIHGWQYLYNMLLFSVEQYVIQLYAVESPCRRVTSDFSKRLLKNYCPFLFSHILYIGTERKFLLSHIQAVIHRILLVSLLLVAQGKLYLKFILHFQQ